MKLWCKSPLWLTRLGQDLLWRLPQDTCTLRIHHTTPSPVKTNKRMLAGTRGCRRWGVHVYVHVREKKDVQLYSGSAYSYLDLISEDGEGYQYMDYGDRSEQEGDQNNSMVMCSAYISSTAEQKQRARRGFWPNELELRKLPDTHAIGCGLFALPDSNVCINVSYTTLIMCKLVRVRRGEGLDNAVVDPGVICWVCMNPPFCQS